MVEMTWIDAHIHIGEDTGGMVLTYEDVEELFEQGWLDKAVVFAFDEVDGIPRGNTRIHELVGTDDRLAGLFRIDPAIHGPEDLENAVDKGFSGFKMHPRAQEFSMHRVYEHLETIGDLDVPVLVHTGVGDDPGQSRAHPEEVLDAADIHGDTDIILAHNTKGYYFHAPDSFVQTFQACDNAYLDISLHCTPLSVETLVNDLGSEKLLFASDYPYGHPVPMQKNVELATIPGHAMENIAWKNAERLFF